MFNSGSFIQKLAANNVISNNQDSFMKQQESDIDIVGEDAKSTDNNDKIRDEENESLERNLCNNDIDMIHKKLKPYTCNECDDAFGDIGHLQIHIDSTHRKLSPYKCNECGKTFGYKNSLKDHIDFSHNEIKNYECDECGRKFARKVTLQHHMRIHTGERPYQCNKCRKKFMHNSSYRRHRRKCKK